MMYIRTEKIGCIYEHATFSKLKNKHSSNVVFRYLHSLMAKFIQAHMHRNSKYHT